VLDFGCQHSYIIEHAARFMSLKSKSLPKMSIFTFGSSDQTLSDCNLVHVVMKTLDGVIELSLLTTPIICGPLIGQPINLCVDMYENF